MRDGLSRQELALDTAAHRLKGEFADTFDAETVEQCLHSSYDRLAWRAKVVAFLPLLAERVTRQHLQALAGVDETSAAVESGVLFASYNDVARSPVTPAPSVSSSTIAAWLPRATRTAVLASNAAAV